VYAIGTFFAGGESVEMPLLEKNGYLPDFDAIDGATLKRAKLMFLNYPNNPTAASAGMEFFEKAVSFAKKHDIIVCHDAAYSEVFYDGVRPPSFLEVEGAKEVGIEIHSLSKTYNMTGWRIGFAVGNADVVGGLAKIKSNLDSGAFDAVQEAGVVALETGDEVLAPLRNMYQERRDALYEGLRAAGIETAKPGATFYLWAKVPKGFDSSSFSAHLLERAGVLATPGNGFGASGEGYIRFALTVPVERIKEAAVRIKKTL
jgi:LL-diaminopimelate aminotransferase